MNVPQHALDNAKTSLKSAVVRLDCCKNGILLRPSINYEILPLSPGQLVADDWGLLLSQPEPVAVLSPENQ